jgi:hypothetical protein
MRVRVPSERPNARMHFSIRSRFRRLEGERLVFLTKHKAYYPGPLLKYGTLANTRERSNKSRLLSLVRLGLYEISNG